MKYCDGQRVARVRPTMSVESVGKKSLLRRKGVPTVDLPKSRFTTYKPSQFRSPTVLPDPFPPPEVDYRHIRGAGKFEQIVQTCANGSPS